MRMGKAFGGLTSWETRRAKKERGDQLRLRASRNSRMQPAKRMGRPPEAIVPIQGDLIAPPSLAKDIKLPSNEELIARSIQLRQRCQILFQDDWWRENPTVRSSVIEDIADDGRLLLAQTSPPVLKSHTGKSMRLSFAARYLDMPGGRWLRVGYVTDLLEVIPNYRLSAASRDTVLAVAPPAKLEPDSIRTAFRLAPPPELDINLLTLPERLPLGLLDFSAGGARFHHPLIWYYTIGSVMRLAITSGKLEFRLRGRVVRTGRIHDIRGRELGVTSVGFVDWDPHTQRDFLDFVQETYRYLLSKRSGVKPKRLFNRRSPAEDPA